MNSSTQFIMDFFVEMEKNAVNNMGISGNVTIPIPADTERKLMMEKGLIFGDKIDNVLINCTLPNNWKISVPQNDEDHRVRFIVDENLKPIIRIFLKNTGYDYYGYTRVIKYTIN